MEGKGTKLVLETLLVYNSGQRVRKFVIGTW